MFKPRGQIIDYKMAYSQTLQMMMYVHVWKDVNKTLSEKENKLQNNNV